jgi:starvation-inducible DNA-binding protein
MQGYLQRSEKGGHTMQPNIGLSYQQRQGVAQILGPLLSDEYVLYTKTRNYHWNVAGPQFNDLHKFFEAQYNELNDIVDEVAERTRALGEPAIGTLAEFVQHSRLKEHPGHYAEAHDMLANLLLDHETLIQQLRRDLEICAEAYHDMGTNDFLTGLMERHEKMAWMLRAFLEGKSV